MRVHYEASEFQQGVQADGGGVFEAHVRGGRLGHPDGDVEPPAVDALINIERRRSGVDDGRLKLRPVKRMKPVADRDTNSDTGFLCEVYTVTTARGPRGHDLERKTRKAR